MTSVIVPVHNAERFLPDVLDSLAAQDHAGIWEVVLVDNGSRDRSAAVARGYQGRLPIVVTSAVEQRNPAYARNAGVQLASGSAFLFIDADDAVAPDYVRLMTEALRHHELVTSRVDSTRLNEPWLQGAHGAPWQEHGVSAFYDFLPGTGVNIGIRRDEFERLRGFSSEFFSAEDVAFVWTAQLSGLEIHFVREAVYFYRHRESMWGLLRQATHWGSDSVRLYRKFRHVGMPGRPADRVAAEWLGICADLVHVRSRAALAACTVRTGLAIGRTFGSARYRTAYL